jgi:hypothetical protein
MRMTRRNHNERGSTMVEFAMTIVFVLVMVFWAWELIMLVYTYNVMAGAAKEGVRYAVVHGTGNTVLCSAPCTGTCTDRAGCVQNVVQDYAKYSFHDVSGLTVSVTYPDGSVQPPSRVRVVVQYAYQPYFTLPWTPPTLNAAAEGRIVN